MNGYLREAQENDTDLLYNWANEEAVRRNSFHTEQIPYSEHLNWFHNLLTSSCIKQYIYIDDGEPVGQVRITVDKDEAELSYSITKEKRGMGHARIMLTLLKQKVQEDFPQVKKLTAKVKSSNLASQKVFRGLNYESKYEVFETVLEEG